MLPPSFPIHIPSFLCMVLSSSTMAQEETVGQVCPQQSILLMEKIRVVKEVSCPFRLLLHG